jgi:hypothetical protein
MEDKGMAKSLTRALIGAWLLVLAPLVGADNAPATPASPATPAEHQEYRDDEIVKSASDFFSNGAHELSDVLAKVLKEKGRPIAIIRGEEVSGAVAAGLRYGHGELVYRDGTRTTVYWQGPSVGFDIGANAVKVYMLVYKLPNTDAIFQRFPGVEGSLYFVGGFGVHYLQSNGIGIAPVRFGVGWRQGVDVGYLNFSREKRINPF